jgi:hypothetical protein
VAILTRARFAEGFLGAGSFGVLVAAVAALDDTVQERIFGVLNGGMSNNLQHAGSTLERNARIAMDMAVDFSASNTPMVVFVSVAVVLLLLMLRS